MKAGIIIERVVIVGTQSGYWFKNEELSRNIIPSNGTEFRLKDLGVIESANLEATKNHNLPIEFTGRTDPTFLLVAWLPIRAGVR